MKDTVTFVPTGKEYKEIRVFRSVLQPCLGWDLLCIVYETEIVDVDMEIPVWNPNGAYLTTQMCKRPVERSVPIFVMGRTEEGVIEDLKKSNEEFSAQVDTLTKEISGASKCLKDRAARIIALEDVVKTKTSEILECKKSRDELRNKHEELASSMTRLRDRLGEVRMTELLNPDGLGR